MWVLTYSTLPYSSWQGVNGVQGERALQMDVQEGARLQLQAFEAINEVVRSASPDTLPLVGQLIQALLDKLASTLRMQVSGSEAKEHQKDLQVWLANTHMLLSHVGLRGKSRKALLA